MVYKLTPPLASSDRDRRAVFGLLTFWVVSYYLTPLGLR